MATAPLARSVAAVQRRVGNRVARQLLAPEPQDGSVSTEVAGAIEAARGGGQPLQPASREVMEPALGADLGTVRVHTDPEADRLSRAVDAVAFTVGRDVFFSQGAYRPETTSGRELLAHELAHVLQQGGLQRRLVVGRADDPLEREADDLARLVVARSAEPAAGTPGGEDRARGVGSAFDDEGGIRRQAQQPRTVVAQASPYDRVQDFVRKAGRAWAKNREWFALALRRFQRRMQMTSEAATVPDVAGALVRHVTEKITGAALAKVETLLPGWGHVKGALDAMVGELERADTARQELRLRDFLNEVDTVMTRGFVAQVEAIEAGQADLWETYLALEPEIAPLFLDSFGNWLARINEEIPSDAEYEAALYIEWVNRHYGQLRRSTSLGRIQIKFNAERPGDYRFQSATVLSSYSDKVAEGLNWVMRTPELGMPNVLHLPIRKVVGLYTENLVGGRSYGWVHLDERNRTVQESVLPVARQRWRDMPWEPFEQIRELSG